MIFQIQFQNHGGQYSYLLASSESHEAVLVDPVGDLMASYNSTLSTIDCKLRYTLETGSVEGSVDAASALRDQLGCVNVAPRGDTRPAPVLRAEHGDRIPIGDRVVEVLGPRNLACEKLSYLIGDQLFCGDLSVRDEPALSSLAPDTAVFRSGDVRGASTSLVALERGPGILEWGRWRAGEGAFLETGAAVAGANQAPHDAPHEAPSGRFERRVA